MMAAGGVVLPVPVPAPSQGRTRQRRRGTRRGRQPTNGRAGVIDPISLPLYPNCMIPSPTAGLVEIENEGPNEIEIHDSILRDRLLNRVRGVRNSDGFLRPAPGTSLTRERSKLPVNSSSIMSRLGPTGPFVEDEISESILNLQRGVANGFLSPQDTSISSSSHLRGRINPPVKANAAAHSPSERGREAPRGIVWDRLSPDQPIRRRLRDRIEWPLRPADLGREAPKGIVWDRLSPDQPIRRSLRDRIEWPLCPADLGREASKGIVWDGLSPEQPIRRSLRNRIKWPLGPADLGTEGRNPRRVPPTQRDLMVHRNTAALARPKTLAELKSGKTAENKDHSSSHSLGEQRSSFDGPKPLAVILKRKKEAAGVPFSKTSDEAAHMKNWNGSLAASFGMAAAEASRSAVCSPPTKEIASDYDHSDKEGWQSHKDAHKKDREGSLGGSSGASIAESSNAVFSRPAKEIASYYAPSDKEEHKSQGDAHKKKWKGSLDGFAGTSVAETRSLGASSVTSAAGTRNAVCSPPAKEISSNYAPSDKEECQSQEDAHKKNRKGSLGGSSETSVLEIHIAVFSPPAKESASGYAPSDKKECKSQEDAHKKYRKGSLGDSSGTSAAETRSLGDSSGTSTAKTTNVVCSPFTKNIAMDYAHSDKEECISGPVVSDKLGNKGRNLSKIAENKDPLHSFGGKRNFFEEPKPLVVVLKRKREAAGVMLFSETGEEAAHNKKWKGSLGASSGTSAAAETYNAACSPPTKAIAGCHAHSEKKVEQKSQEGVLFEGIEDKDVMFTMIRGMRTMSISKA